MNGAKGRYLDYLLHFRGLESKRGNVKPSYLIEIHSEIATSRPEYRPDRYEMCCIYSLWYLQMNGGEQEAIISTTSCTFESLDANAVMSNHRI